MKDVDHLAQALDACLSRAGAARGDALAAAPAWPEVADELAPLVEIAQALRAAPAIPGPTPAFRRQLAAALMAAPQPRSLQPSPVSAVAVVPGAPSAGAHSTSALVQMLDAGLRGVQAGRDVDDVLDAHPDIAPDLEPLLALAADLAAFPPIPAPSEAFRQRLAADLAAAPEPRSIAARRARPATGWLRRLWRSTAFTAAAAATFVLFLTAGVTYASANALPGQLLYPVKRLAEQARVWLAGADAVNLHLLLADRRLKESLAAPDRAGELLADFSRAVTAALGAVDQRLAAGEPRPAVTAPVLSWLLGARTRLVDGRPDLPPTAWRAALALVDEAIAALSGGSPLSVAPVPRLVAAADDGSRLRVVVVPRLRPARLIAAGGRPPSRAGDRTRVIAPDRGHASPAVGPIAPGASIGAPTIATPAAAAPTALAAMPIPGQSDPPRGRDEPEDPTPDAGVTAIASPVMVPTIETPAPTATASPMPSQTATSEPTVPASQPPVITSVSCTPQKLEGYGEATCTVVASGPEGGDLTYLWYVSPLHGEMKRPDLPESKLQVWPPGSGYEPRPITIQITVTDAAGQSAVGKTEVIVVPVLEGEQ